MSSALLEPPRLKIPAQVLGRGLAAAVLHGLAMAALLQAGAHPWLASGLGFAGGLAANYGLQRGYLLRYGEPPGRALSRYIADTSVLWGLHLFLFGLLTGVAGAPVFTAQVASSAAAGGLGLCFLARPRRYGPV